MGIFPIRVTRRIEFMLCKDIIWGAGVCGGAVGAFVYVSVCVCVSLRVLVCVGW